MAVFGATAPPRETGFVTEDDVGAGAGRQRVGEAARLRRGSVVVGEDGCAYRTRDSSCPAVVPFCEILQVRSSGDSEPNVWVVGSSWGLLLELRVRESWNIGFISLNGKGKKTLVLAMQVAWTSSSSGGGDSQMPGLGGGAGKGGGGGGSIRDAGGAFGKMEAAREEQYFRKLARKQLDDLKSHLDEQISYHEHEIKMHMEKIEAHRKRVHDIAEMQKKEKE
ncbi:unnamed protein product [Darwinula stevensoni]|uniref:ATP synthase F1 subunit epsilon n=1 Tax=Darwinula stevensoni TaxID=69355 RepID=A0A7R9A670_9CRUS|nr:unnamed protein product [Darwinula stevensoni]CAG0888224.1 unnamed protein product [Darwinula stevensoni]